MYSIQQNTTYFQKFIPNINQSVIKRYITVLNSAFLVNERHNKINKTFIYQCDNNSNTNESDFNTLIKRLPEIIRWSFAGAPSSLYFIPRFILGVRIDILGRREEWEIQFCSSRIPYVCGTIKELTDRDSEVIARSDPAFQRFLIKHHLADSIAFSLDNPPLSFHLASGYYLHSKIIEIDILQSARMTNTPPVRISLIWNLYLEINLIINKIVFFENFIKENQFIKKCDELLLRQWGEEEFNKKLTLLGVTLNQWFAAV